MSGPGGPRSDKRLLDLPALQHPGPAALHLLWADDLFGGRQEPAIAEGTGDHAGTVAIELVRHVAHQRGACLLGLGRWHVEAPRRPADRRRALGAEVGILVVQHEHAVADLDLGMSDPARKARAGGTARSRRTPWHKKAIASLASCTVIWARRV